MAKTTTVCFRPHRLSWIALLLLILVSTLLASLWGLSYESAPSSESCWVVPSWSKGTFRPDQKMYYQGMAGTDLRLAWEQDSDFNTLHTLYVTAIATSAIGLLFSVREYQTNASQAFGARQSYTISLMLYFLLGFITNVVIQMCFARNRCHDHNAHYALPLEIADTREWVDISSPASRITKALYLTFIFVGGLFTNTLLGHVLLRKASLLECHNSVLQWHMKTASMLNVVLLFVNAMALPVALVFFKCMMEDGIKVVGGIDTGEMITLIFNIAVIFIIASHSYIAVVLLVASAILSRKLSDQQVQPIKDQICTVVLILSTLVCYGNMALMLENAYIVLPFDSIVNNTCIVIMTFNGVCQETSVANDVMLFDLNRDIGDVHDKRPDEEQFAAEIVCIKAQRKSSTHSILSVASVVEEVVVAIRSINSLNKYKRMSCNGEERWELQKQMAVNVCPTDDLETGVSLPNTICSPRPPPTLISIDRPPSEEACDTPGYWY